MITANDITRGIAIEIEGEPYMVVNWKKVTRAQVDPDVKVKLRHIRTHDLIERTLDAHSELTVVPIERLAAVFTHWDGEFYHFADIGSDNPDDPDEFQLPPEMLGKASKFIVDELQLNMLVLNSEPVGVELPPSVIMRVKSVDMVGRYWRAIMEGPARLETGLVVMVPPIISPGDLIRVNTENGEYMERITP
ncbi:elongation factor P [Dictyobacter formicarum]|uniref:Elongation factor P n=1 Tax=Dictyobacter formicarum TaxID=2778368 RepID=A0ABQ3VU08_9CHLR|nr:elongation factor P [Dictyobacter formicarum]GHO88591.1 elongation factor P [Dictyobacter formicarum]